MRFLRLMAVALALTAQVGCGDRTAPAPDTLPDPNTKSVTGRTSTGTGISIDFPAGWSQVELHGPFTKSYESRKANLNLDLVDLHMPQMTAESIGTRIANDFASKGEVIEKGPVTIDGREAYAVTVKIKKDSGFGLLRVFVISRSSGRITQAYISTRSDEVGSQRADIDALSTSFKVDG